MKIITNIANGPELPPILMIKDVYDDDHSGDYHHGDEEKTRSSKMNVAPWLR